MDLTGADSQSWMGRGYIKAASTDGSDVSITGDPGTLPDDPDDVLTELLADHDVARYPGDALIGWFPTDDLPGADIRDPAAVSADPFPFDSG